MKTLARIIVLVILAIHVYNNSIAQKANYTTNEGLTLGFGLGGAYQKSDLVNSRGGGFDFVFGSQLYKKEYAFFSLDWKFRFLAGENRAYDHRINPDNTYSNIQYRFFTYDLELGLTLNRLRERTRIVVTGFAGAGITHGITATDLYDAGNNLYDYSGIDPNRARKLVYDDLVSLSDGDFETKLINRAAILPTAGFFIGYQFSRSFSMGIEFKTNFYLSENNSAFGSDLDNRVIEGSAMDRNNYVGLGFKWSLRGGSSYGSSYWENRVDTQPVPGSTVTAAPVTPRPETTAPETRITEPPVYMPQPVVHIFDPSADPYLTASGTHTIQATVRGVSGAEDIRFYQDGEVNRNFTYNAAVRTFRAEVQLRDGENSFRIVATNQTASTEDQVSITVDQSPVADEPEVVVVPASPPEVEIISPANDPFRTFESSAGLRAMVLNVDSKEEITLNINGVNTRDFTFDARTKVLTTDVALRNGSNRLKISAENQAGSDVENRVFVKEIRPCPPPMIRLIAPALEQSDANEQTYEVWAEVRNIAGSNQLRLVVNGRPVTFSFNNNLVRTTVPLVNGINTLSLNAMNECGEEQVSARINYRPAVAVVPTCIPPKVSFTVKEVNRENASHELSGSISNLRDESGISLMVDGSPKDGFRFNPATGELNARLNLTPGLHTVIVSVRNACGTDNLGVNVNMKEPCIPPKVSFTVTELDRDDASHELVGSVSGVKGRSGISLSVNGNRDDRFRFLPQTGDLNADLRLTPGSHTILVSVTNDCGSDDQRVSVAMEEPCIPPKVSFNVREVNRADASHELRGLVSNVKDRSDVSLTMDGSAVEDFRFNPASGDLNADLRLAPGSHTVVVSAASACGSDNQAVSIMVEETCIPPRVSITVNEVDRGNASHEMRGSVSNVKNRSDISLTLDGRSDDDFRFNVETGDLSGEYQLTPGPHTIIVSASNACGSDNQQVSINIGEPCVPPKVSFSVHEVNLDDAGHELRGSVANVKDRSGISITVNGSPDNRFLFVPETGDLNTTFKLTPGSHAIVVSVSNECGTDKQSVSINIEEPCVPPKVSITVNEVNRNDASHELAGSVSNVEDRAGISLTVDGSPDDGFQFDPSTGELSSKIKLAPGSHEIMVSVTNPCGQDKQDVSVIIEEPCTPPKVSFTVTELDRDDASHELAGSVSNVEDRADVSLTVDGSPDDTFQFVPGTGTLNAKFNLTPGSHVIVVSVTNPCGSDIQTLNVIMEEPCIPPRVSFTIAEVSRDDASHELSGSVSNVEDRADVSLTVNGSLEEGFEFDPSSGELNAKLNPGPGAHMIVVSVSNACGADNQGVNIIVEEEACGVRINPGNSTWQFCLVTPAGTFTRENLTNENFSYSGPASSLYFLPIGGGGEVTVNGSPHTIRSGRYYLFTGNLEVSVSTTNPGSMGHWSVCVNADAEPVSGQGNNRPESPCAEEPGNNRGQGNKR